MTDTASGAAVRTLPAPAGRSIDDSIGDWRHFMQSGAIGPAQSLTDREPLGRPLAPVPRPIPPEWRFAAVSWHGWDMFVLAVIGGTPLALWILFPWAAPAAGLLAATWLLFVRLRKSSLRNSLLRWGDAATAIASRAVVGPSPTDTRQADSISESRSWAVSRDWYEGPRLSTEIDYSTGSIVGRLILRGRPYDGSEILTDSRNPDRALLVSAFPWKLQVDASGQWVPQPQPRLWVGMTATITVYTVWIAACLVIAVRTWGG